MSSFSAAIAGLWAKWNFQATNLVLFLAYFHFQLCSLRTIENCIQFYAMGKCLGIANILGYLATQALFIVTNAEILSIVSGVILSVWGKLPQDQICCWVVWSNSTKGKEGIYLPSMQPTWVWSLNSYMILQTCQK